MKAFLLTGIIVVDAVDFETELVILYMKRR